MIELDTFKHFKTGYKMAFVISFLQERAGHGLDTKYAKGNQFY